MALSKFPVILFFDVISPYSWIAFEVLMRYQKVWEKMDLCLKPCSIRHVVQYSNNETPFSNAPKLNYQFKDVHLMAKYSKVPLKVPSNFVKLALENGSIPAMKFLTSVDALSDGKEMENISRQLWRQTFTNDPAPDLNTAEIWLEAGRNAGTEPNLLHEAIVQAETPVMKHNLVQASKEAVEYGAFGLPFIVVKSAQGPVIFFGSDRIELLAHTIGEKYRGPNP